MRASTARLVLLRISLISQSIFRHACPWNSHPVLQLVPISSTQAKLCTIDEQTAYSPDSFTSRRRTLSSLTVAEVDSTERILIQLLLKFCHGPPQKVGFLPYMQTDVVVRGFNPINFRS